MKPRYAIQLPSGAYFVNADTPNGGTRREALGFEHKRAAVNYLRLFPKLAPGGAVVSLRPLHGRRARRAQWLADAAELYRAHLLYFYGAGAGPEEVGRVIRARSEAKRARLAARRAA